MAQLLKGAPAAAALTEALAQRSEALQGKGVTPALAILRVGERPDDLSYETGAAKRCEKAGIAVRRVSLPASCTRDDLLSAIQSINADPAVHGCLMLRPLPDPEAEWSACRLLDPRKDVDGITPSALGAVFTGRGSGFPPCTAQACIELLDFYNIPIEGRRAVVIGRSLVIGRPVSMLLQHRNATVTMCHSRTRDLPAICRQADILIAAAGQPQMVTAAFSSPAQIVLDVGIHAGENGRLCGDADFNALEPIAAALTPVPGGIGAVTTAVLAKHVIQAAEKMQAL